MVFACLVLALSAWAQEKISYTVTVSDPASAVFHVEMFVKGVRDSVLPVRISHWCPGWYTITRYQEQISHVRAEANGRELHIATPEDRLWEIRSDGSPLVKISYDVKATDPGFGFFAAHLEPDHGFINAVSTCMYIKGRTLEPVSIHFDLPVGWQIATPLEEGPQPATFKAKDFEELIDSPFELGKFKRVDFEAAGVPMFATFTYRGEMHADPAKVVADLKKIAETHIALFGGAPMKRYMFNIHMDVGSFGGGLEHRASTTLAIGDRENLDIRGLASHEFFHLWNVKRIRPKILGPFDFGGEQRTKNLWFAEGVTSYYGDRAMYRAGMMDKAGWLGRVLGEINGLFGSSDRLRYTAEDASWKGWEGGSMGYGNLSYYNKGFVIGAMLDIAIRARTGGQKSLDDVMRTLMKEHNPPKPGYEEDGILTTINEVTGQDFTELYDVLVRSTKEPPYQELFAAAGLHYEASQPKTDAGFSTELPGTTAYPRVSEVHAIATQIGLQVGDVLLKVNEKDVRGAATPLQGVKPNDSYVVQVLRRGTKMEFTGTITAMSQSEAVLSVSDRLTPVQQKILDGYFAR